MKPDGWLDDESELIPDPEAERPADWDDDMDGEWEAAKIDNPLCQEAPGKTHSTISPSGRICRLAFFFSSH